MISLRSRDGGDFRAYLALPASGRGPGVVVLQEIFGVNGFIRDVCHWLADRGYVAIAPDLFWRQEPGIELDESQFEKAISMYYAMDEAKAVDDAGVALEWIRANPACTGKAGAIGFCLGGKLAYLVAVRHKPDAAVGYYGVGIERSLDEVGNLACPLMFHFAGLDKFAPVEAQNKVRAALPQATIHSYPLCDHAFARPGGAHYDEQAAELANLRTIDFFARHLSPSLNLEALWGEHIKHEFDTQDTQHTLETMVEDAYVNHIPVLTGGVGLQQLGEFYSRHFIPQMPPDTSMTPISRTVGANQLVDEMIFRFTHTIRMDWMLPGIEPTGKRVEVPLTAIVRFRDGKLAHEHIYWDQASVLVQLGLLDPARFPVAGVESARKALDPKLPARQLGGS
jgi:carboxymethylenebutenolidase